MSVKMALDAKWDGKPCVIFVVKVTSVIEVALVGHWLELPSTVKEPLVSVIKDDLVWRWEMFHHVP